jgi:hypothetical protein
MASGPVMKDRAVVVAEALTASTDSREGVQSCLQVALMLGPQGYILTQAHRTTYQAHLCIMQPQQMCWGVTLHHLPSGTTALYAGGASFCAGGSHLNLLLSEVVAAGLLLDSWSFCGGGMSACEIEERGAWVSKPVAM